MLTISSILDVLRREIEPKFWLLMLPITALVLLLNFASSDSWITLIIYVAASIGLALIATIVPYKMGIFGGADVICLALLAALNPLPLKGILPPILPIIVYSSLLLVVQAPALFLYNIIFNRREVSRLRTSTLKKIIIASTGVPVDAERYLSSKFFFPLELIDKRGRRKLRVSFDVEEDDYEHRIHVANLIRNGIISSDTKIWVTYGHPFLVYVLIGYIVWLVVGDAPLISIMKHLACMLTLYPAVTPLQLP